MNEIIKENNLYKIDSIVNNRLRFIIDKVNLENTETILDIGSWHLEQSLEFNRIFPQSKIYAFEPVPASYGLCLRKKKDNISVFNIALSDKTGELPFYEVDVNSSSHPNVGASSLLKFKKGLNGSFFNQVWNQKEITVKSMTLDDWCLENNINTIDIVWIDVQGAELDVFKGGSKILQNTKIIFTEVGLKPYYEGHSLQSDIDSFLTSIGFVEIKDSFELNGFDYEANTIYVNSKHLI
jgi:FkbM family methyltransferase